MYQKENAQPRNAELSASEPSANATTGFVLAPLHNQQPITMTSLEVVDFINGQRSTEEPELRHDHFMVKVPKVLGESHAPNFLGTQVYGNNNTRHICHLPKREACLMAMSYSYELQAKVFDHMTTLEAQQALGLPNFADPVAAARAWADAKEGEQRAVAQLALAAPKVAYVDRYVAAKGALGFREVAKLLKAKEPEFCAFLKGSRILYRLEGRLTPYQNHIEAGRFTIKTGVNQLNEHAFAQARFTPKGVEWIAGLWMQHQVRLKQGSEVAA